MLKNDKGITMTVLIITVIVLLLLTGISLNVGFSDVNDVKASRAIAYMQLVESKVKIIYDDYEFDGTELVGVSQLKTTDLSSEGVYLSDEEKSIIATEANVSDISNWTWYKWNADTLKEQGLDKSMLESESTTRYFYVNYEHGEILYSKSSKVSGVSYYSKTALESVLATNQ